jgi:hypothetical protein
VVVPVAFVGGVAVPVVDIVDVALVWHCHVTALRTVLVGVAIVRNVPALSAFVHMVAVLVVNVAVMHIVGVIAVRDRDVAAALPVRMIMTSMLFVLEGSRHGSLVLLVPELQNAACAKSGLPAGSW